MKILVAGAGPTGLTAGVELARQGIDVRIIERRKGGSSLSRAVGISPRSLQLLTPSGVTATLLSRGVNYEFIRIYNKAKLWVKLPLTAAPIKHGFNIMLGLPQDQTETILRERFESYGGTLEYGTELKSVAQNSDSVTVQTTDGQSLQADYLIGADGYHSATRESAGINIHRTDLPGYWSIADVDADNWQHSDAATICLLPKGTMVAMIPLGGKRFRLISNTENALEAQPFDIKVSKVRREGKFKIALSHVDEYNRGRVYLAGDAAHSQSPAGGRGMNLGISDACDLASRFANGDLSSYSAERRKEGRHMMAGAETIRKVLSSSNAINRILLLAALKVIATVPVLQKVFASRFLYG